MAEGLAKALLGPLNVRIGSAGTAPTRICPLAVRVMAEIGIDISRHHTSALDAVTVAPLDTIVLVESRIRLPPRFAAVPQITWPVEDPCRTGLSPKSALRGFRLVRDDLEWRVLSMIASWRGASSPAKR